MVEAIPALTKMLDDPDAECRGSAAGALGALGPVASATPFRTRRKLTGDRDPNVRAIAVEALRPDSRRIPLKKVDFDRLLKEKVLIFDGAMGTNLQAHNPTVDDYAGLEGCTEILLDTHPEWIEKLHASFFEVGMPGHRNRFLRR